MPINQLVHKACQARENAYAPYSRFRVGAALLSANGVIYTGCNIETSSLGLTICAERVALVKAISEGQSAFHAIAIASSTRKICMPCGACRQMLWDLAGNIDIILTEEDQPAKQMKLADLLPHAFNRQDLPE
ncbi:cytidine deaminase [candidate division KSB1 bacterium]|nr:cytidine deaminase [candidate division KSB1 bacterium]